MIPFPFFYSPFPVSQCTSGKHQTEHSPWSETESGPVGEGEALWSGNGARLLLDRGCLGGH